MKVCTRSAHFLLFIFKQLEDLSGWLGANSDIFKSFLCAGAIVRFINEYDPRCVPWEVIITVFRMFRASTFEGRRNRGGMRQPDIKEPRLRKRLGAHDATRSPSGSTHQ